MNDLVKSLRSTFPHLLERDDRFRCVVPRCGWGVKFGTYPSVVNLVVHLNDIHKWNRESIADWLDELDTDLTFPVPSDL